MVKKDSKTYSVVCLEVIYLFAEDEHPEVFAEEFYYVEGVCEARSIAGESMRGVQQVSLCCCSEWSLLAINPILLIKQYHVEWMEGDTQETNTPLYKTLPNSISQHLQPKKHCISLLILIHFLSIAIPIRICIPCHTHIAPLQAPTPCPIFLIYPIIHCSSVNFIYDAVCHRYELNHEEV